MDMKELRKLTQKLRVLYVEDEDIVREKTIKFFNNFFDDIVVATNGQKGLESFEKGKFDLVITDLKMPKLSGEKLIEKVKAHRPETIVIAMSGLSDNEEIENLESDFYLVKPITINDFKSVLTEILEK